jgi:1-acyl-sn-glycerol-3-phosphate acyltransferase
MRMAGHILKGFGLLALAFPNATPEQRNVMVRAWGLHVLRIFNIDLTVTKPEDFDPTKPGRMLIGNHISWLDIYVMQGITAARFVAKAELAQWPVLGGLIRGSGTVFIERTKRSDTLRINQTVMNRLADGTIIGVFPEGTTTDGRDVLKFHANLLQAPIDGGFEIVPFCLRYTDPDGNYTNATAYIGDMTFWDSIKIVLREPSLRCELFFFPILKPEGRTRRELAAVAETMVREQLQRPAPRV